MAIDLEKYTCNVCKNKLSVCKCYMKFRIHELHDMAFEYEQEMQSRPHNTHDFIAWIKNNFPR